MDMILLRPSMPRDTSIPCSGKSIGITVGFGDFGKVRRTKSVRLVHKPGGAEHARWVFDYSPDEEDDEAGYKFGVHAFLPGEYLSISGQDGKQHTFLVVAVDPVVLSVDLVKSFQLEIEV